MHQTFLIATAINSNEGQLYIDGRLGIDRQLGQDRVELAFCLGEMAQRTISPGLDLRQLQADARQLGSPLQILRIPVENGCHRSEQGGLIARGEGCDELSCPLCLGEGPVIVA